MTVAAILGSKDIGVVTVPPHRTLEETTRLLAEHRIGTVVVTSADGQLLGILSERDIVKAVAAEGSGALTHAVSQHMTKRVEVARRDELVDSIMERMTRGRFRHMPVVENGRLVGIVSIGDVVKHRLAQIEQETSAMRDYIATA